MSDELVQTPEGRLLGSTSGDPPSVEATLGECFASKINGKSLGVFPTKAAAQAAIIDVVNEFFRPRRVQAWKKEQLPLPPRVERLLKLLLSIAYTDNLPTRGFYLRTTQRPRTGAEPYLCCDLRINLHALMVWEKDMKPNARVTSLVNELWGLRLSSPMRRMGSRAERAQAAE